MTDIIQLENKYYISVNSTYADDRVKVLNHADSFGIFDRWGDVKKIGDEVQGIFTPNESATAADIPPHHLGS